MCVSGRGECSEQYINRAPTKHAPAHDPCFITDRVMYWPWLSVTRPAGEKYQCHTTLGIINIQIIVWYLPDIVLSNELKFAFLALSTQKLHY